MSAVPREELDFKMQSMQVNMDGRFTSVDGRFTGLEGRFTVMEGRMDRLESMMTELRADVRGLRSTIVITAISTVFACVFGVAAFNATVLSNMLAAFESGKNTSAAQAEVKRQLEQSAVLLQQMQQRIDHLPPAH